MADPDLQGTASSNKTANTALNFFGTSKNEASVSPLPSSWSRSLGHPTSDSSSDFPISLTVQRETFFGESHRNAPPPKYKHDTCMECGSTTDMDIFSLRLANTEGEDENMDKDYTNKRDIGELQESRQKQTAMGIDKLEEKRAVDSADAKSGDCISEVRPLRLFNFPLREITSAPHNSSSAINESGEPSANTSSILPGSVQHSLSPCTVDYPPSIIGGGEQHKETECASFKPLANCHSTFKTRSISTGKPPLPPGAVTHLKGVVAAKGNKIHSLNMPQDSRKRIRLSDSASEKVVSAAKPDNERLGERGNSNPPYGRRDWASKGLATKCENFDKVGSLDTNSSMEMVTSSNYILAGHPESSVQVNSLPQQEFLVFGNFNVKNCLGNQGIGEGNRKNASTMDPKRKLFQLSKYCATGKVHRQSFFEEENKNIQQLTIGESSCSNNGTTLQVTSGSLQNTSGLLSTSFAPISRGQESYGFLATSLGGNMPENMAKYSSQDFFHFKSSKDDIVQCDGEPSSRVTSTTDKSKMTISMQQVGSSPCSPHNIDRRQFQVCRTSSTDSSSCEVIVAHNYKVKTEHCPHVDRDRMNTMKRDYGSYNKTHLKGPVYLSQAERSKALQVSSESAIKQLHHNVSESAEGYRHRSGSCSIGAEFGNFDRIQRQPNQVNVDVCNLDSQRGETVLGASSEVVLSFCERDLSNSKTVNEHPNNIIASRDSLVVLEHQMDANLRSSQECSMHITQDSLSKRLKKTLHCVEKMHEPSFSDMVKTHGQIRQIIGGPQSSKDPEEIRLLHRLEITKASQEASGSKRLSAYKKDMHEQHHGSLHVPYLGDNMTSCLQKHPGHIDHQASSSVVDLNLTFLGENTIGPAVHASEGKALQRSVGPSRSQRKIDAASVLSHPWIQRWRPSYQIESSVSEMRCGWLTNKKFRSLPHPFAPMKVMPSAAAMAIVGIAGRQLPPCHLQKKGSFSVWTAVGLTMNRTTSSQ